jgi:endo-1,4-beta-xylanase
VWVVALVVVTSVGCVPVGRPGQRPHPRRCAVAGDCRLWEAARGAGLRFGLLGGPEPSAATDVALAESRTFTNHAFSWNVIWPERDRWNFAPADAGNRYARRHHLFQTGFHFAWDQQLLDDLPEWVERITDPDELRAVIRERARVIFRRYPRLDAIDVVNEPLEVAGGGTYRNHFFEVLGPDYVEQLFRIVADEAPRRTRLFVNENLVEYFPAKADALVALVRDLVDSGARIDAVGLQTHLFLGEPDWTLLRTTMERLADLGVEVWVTELDAPVPVDQPDRLAVQAERYRRVVATCLDVDACRSVFVWGVSDADSWINWFLAPSLSPLLFDEGLAPKPAYFATRDALLAGRR